MPCSNLDQFDQNSSADAHIPVLLQYRHATYLARRKQTGRAHWHLISSQGQYMNCSVIQTIPFQFFRYALFENENLRTYEPDFMLVFFPTGLKLSEVYVSHQNTRYAGYKAGTENPQLLI